MELRPHQKDPHPVLQGFVPPQTPCGNVIIQNHLAYLCPQGLFPGRLGCPPDRAPGRGWRRGAARTVPGAAPAAEGRDLWGQQHQLGEGLGASDLSSLQAPGEGGTSFLTPCPLGLRPPGSRCAWLSEGSTRRPQSGWPGHLRGVPTADGPSSASDWCRGRSSA